MIGERLKEVRKDNGDTQERLANQLSVSVHSVRAWEQETSSPSHDMLVVICRMYEVSSDYLLGLTDADPRYIENKKKELTPENLLLLKRFEDFLLHEQKNSTKK